MYGAPELGKDRTSMWASADCYALSLTCLQLMAGQTLDDFYVQGGWDYQARPPSHPLFHRHVPRSLGLRCHARLKNTHSLMARNIGVFFCLLVRPDMLRCQSLHQQVEATMLLNR